MKVKLDKGAYMPYREHQADAGFELRCRESAIIEAGSSHLFDTGVHFQIPEGMFGKIESKSGLNCRYNVVSCGGVIDSGYTGSVAVMLYNFGNEAYIFERGDKIAQMVLLRCETPKLEEVDILDETERGDNGFGSTGR